MVHHIALRWLIVVSLGLLSYADENASCYFPDGVTLSPSDVPCNASAPASPCCGGGALCLDNGLCFGRGIISRGSCTDRKWGSGCTPYCQTTNPTGGGPLISCDFTQHTFACGVNSSICSDAANVFTVRGANAFTLRGDQVKNGSGSTGEALSIGPDTTLTLAADAAATSSSTPTTTSAASASATSAGGDNDKSSSGGKFSTGAVVGAALGTGIPLLLALLAALFVIFRQRNQMKNLGQQEKVAVTPSPQSHTPAPGQAQVAPQYQQPYYPPESSVGSPNYAKPPPAFSEAPPNEVNHEMAGDGLRSELPGSKAI